MKFEENRENISEKRTAGKKKRKIIMDKFNIVTTKQFCIATKNAYHKAVGESFRCKDFASLFLLSSRRSGFVANYLIQRTGKEI